MRLLGKATAACTLLALVLGPSPATGSGAWPRYKLPIIAHESSGVDWNAVNIKITQMELLISHINGAEPDCPDETCCTRLVMLGGLSEMIEPEYLDLDTRLRQQYMVAQYPNFRFYVVRSMDYPGLAGDLWGEYAGQGHIVIEGVAGADIWAHELGHYVGLLHDETSGCSNRIMAQYSANQFEGWALTSAECANFHTYYDDIYYGDLCSSAVGTSFTANAETGGIRLAWDESLPGSVPFYNLERSDACWGPFETFAVVTAGDPAVTADSSHYEFLDTGATYARQYFYRLRTTDELVSTDAYATGAPPMPPGAPSDLLAVGEILENGSGVVDLSWTAAAGGGAPVGYYVYRSEYVGMADCSASYTCLGVANGESYLDAGVRTDGVGLAYRVRAFNATGGSNVSNEAGLALHRPVTPGAYMYLDTNANGVHDIGDVLSQTGSTVVDVWLVTDKNRAGVDVGCSDGSAIPNDIGSYSFVLRADGGSVAWSGFVNRMSAFGTPFGLYTDPTYYANGRGGPVQPAGTYRLATVTVTPQTGTPYLVIAESAPPAPTKQTSFGSGCPGLNGDNTLRLGRDWFDTDGAGPFERWETNGIRLVKGQNDQGEPAMTSDGSGGAIIVWEDKRAGTTNRNIYAQRVDATGNPFWVDGGVPICTNLATQETPRIVSDGAGGAIIAWQDRRAGGQHPVDIYAQRVTANGSVLWASDGVPICAATYDQYLSYWGYTRQAMIPDGSGGAILVWQDQRGGGYFYGDIYTQKVNGAGVVQWATNGVAVSTGVTPDPFQFQAVAVSDGAGGAILAWEDYRNDPNGCICVGSREIYAQRVGAAGAVAWGTGGVPICEESGDQNAIAPVSDGAGGAILVWEDARVSASGRDIYAQRINGSGTVQWATNGVVVNAAAGAQSFPSATSDGSGGAIIAWQAGGARVQRLGSNGSMKWNAAGLELSGSGSAVNPRLATDGAGSAVAVWEDGFLQKTLHAQRLNRSTGSAMWTPGGVPLAPVSLPRAQTISDGMGGAVVAWEGTGDSDKDIFVARVAPGGGTYTTDVPEAPITSGSVHLGPVFPNPFNPAVTIRFGVGGSGRARMLIYDVAGRKVRTLFDYEIDAGSRIVRWDGTNDQGGNVASGVYYCRLEALGEKVVRTLTLLR